MTPMKKSLASTNPYLQLDPVQLKKIIRRAATGSTAVEGVHIDHYKATFRKRSSLLKQVNA